MNLQSTSAREAERRYWPIPLLPSKTGRHLAGRLLLYPLLVAGGLLLASPLLWLISSSLQPAGRVFSIPPRWIPSVPMWGNYGEVFLQIPFLLFVRNTLTIAFFTIVGTLASASIVAFGFARLRFLFRDALFLLLLATMMIPGQVTLIPVYTLFRELGWLDSFYPLVAPAFFGGGAFYVFLLRQFFMSLPLELDDAARIDGCGTFHIYARIVLPQARPALGVIAVFTFMSCWNDFFGPLIYLNSRERFTLALGLNLLRGAYFVQWHLLMAASVMSALPCVLLYFGAQRYFIQGIVFTGIKG